MSVQSLESSPSIFIWRASWPTLLGIALVACVSMLPFWDGLTQLWAWWSASPEDSYGMLIPPVAAFLIWQQKDRLEREAFTGSWWGPVLVLLSGVVLLLGQLGTIYAMVQNAFVLSLCGLVLAFLGWRAFRLIAVPLLILFFAVPFPAFLVGNLSNTLELLSSRIGVAFMRLFDVSVYLEGNVIDLGGYKLQVADACSGLRYLFPLMTIGFLMAYFYKGAMWKRVLLFLSSIPITILMNSLRVGIIGITVERWGIAMAEGFLHEFQGWVIFMASAVLMLGEMALLNRLGHETGTFRQLFGIEFPAPTPKGATIRRRGVPASFLAAVIVLLAFVAATFLLRRPVEVIPARASFVDFPMQLGAWQGRRDSLEGVYVDALKLDDYLLADFAGSSNGAVNLYIAYYSSQRKGEAVHSPRTCLPGGGWQIREFGQRTLPTSVGARQLEVNRAVMAQGSERELVYYWFQQRGRIVTNEYAVKWYLFRDALTLHRTDGAMVRLITMLPPASSEEEADRRLTSLAAEVEARLPRFVPN